MSYFAELDENNIVIRVLVGDSDFPNNGYDWFAENLGGTWIETSYDPELRKRFASIGYEYSYELDAFILPKPHESWTLDKSCNWIAPTPQPTDSKNYTWDEKTQDWIEVND